MSSLHTFQGVERFRIQTLGNKLGHISFRILARQEDFLGIKLTSMPYEAGARDKQLKDGGGCHRAYLPYKAGKAGTKYT
jgi:hypothetical protein